MRSAFRFGVCVLACWIAAFAGTALAQPTNTSSESASTEIIPGSPYSIYVWTITYIGPQTIRVGEQTGCTATVPLPPVGCTVGGGTGTLGNPFQYSCQVPLTGCTGGGLLSIVAGGEDIDTFIFSVAPPPAPPLASAQPVPLSPWIPLGSAFFVLLLGLFFRHRVARTPRL